MAPKQISTTEQRERERVGATLRLVRRREGWDLGPFATKIGISYSYLSNIEAGRKPLTDILLARAAKLLDCDPIAIKHPDADGTQESE
ncbi:MAG: family transcriptional regulator [Frankiales bacterium]|nr:family transcriptional regulator [Frankiales bacterium]